MILLVTGSRTIPKNPSEIYKIHKKLNQICCEYGISKLITGGARGVDMTAMKWAWDRKIATEIYPPDWERYGRRAGLLRNITMVEKCDKGVGFWDGKSRGTEHCIKKLKETNKLLEVMEFE